MTPRSRALSAAGTAAVVSGLALLTGCTDSDDPPPPVGHGELRLVSFDSCEEAVEQLRAAAQEHVTAWGFGGLAQMPGFPGDGDDAAGAAEEAGPAPALGADNSRATQPDLSQQTAPEGPAHSGTNVHEAGVEEPDIVKTDGWRILTVHQGTLRVVDAQRRVQTGTLDLFPDADADSDIRWSVADLLLQGDRALVLVGESYWWAEPGAGAEPARPGAVQDDPVPDDPSPTESPIAGPRLLLVDLAGAPEVVEEYTVDGGLVDARAVGSTVRVVVRSAPRLELPQPATGADEAERLAWNRAAIEATPLSDWLPRYQVTTGGGEATTGQVDCAAVSRPATYTGTSMLTVLTFDLAAAGLGDGSPVTVVADGETVYSNGPSLYVANDLRWQLEPVPEDGTMPEIDDRTEIHKFDTSQAGPPRYVGSGAVAGWLINQYAMSEWDGHLRVATTSGESWWGEESESESTVYVLAEQADGSLAEVGSIGGLGAGERIYAVRFAGPVGYVVTFRQTDPLYTVDLSDPAAPEVLGELKITGYSAYLHPIDDGRLVGVGQEADLDGRVQGTQVSLFDVSDLADPQVLAQHHVEYGHSEAEFDPHAFLWWPAERLLVVPLMDYEGNSGALLLRVTDDQLTELGLVTHPADTEWSGHISRSLVIEDTLWTLSDTGLAANSLSTLDQVAWLPF